MRRLLLVAVLLIAAGAACQVLPGESPSATSTPDRPPKPVFTQEKLDRPEKQPATAAPTEETAPEVPKPAKKTPEKPQGTITGRLSYPSEYIPAQRVAAFDTSNMAHNFWVDTNEGDGTYALPVPPGDYYVVAYTLDGLLAGGYSQAVPCGLSVACTDHSLIAVTVAAGATVADIDPSDWYAPPGSYPPKP